MTLATKVDSLRHEARRVGQTTRTFDNWPGLLRDMAAQKLGRGAGELTFAVKDGPRLTVPNVPGARLALYEQFAEDCYRLRTLLEPFRGRPLSVLDVGAHVGSFTVNLARLHPDAQVTCYEPSADSARYLRRNLAANALDDRVRVVEAALAATEGTALFDDNSGGSVHNGLVADGERLVDGSDQLTARHTVEVPTTTFDAAVAAAGRPPELVKLDCEGGEYAMVYASSPASWASVQRVVMEYHVVEGETWDELRSWLAEAGLHVIRHESDAPRIGTAWLSRDRKAHV
ncbi:class I SAM-dependent methyltransferase [Jatrophihabitans fulvus]